jgi:uncharacterized protein (DUF1800 family)
MPTDAAWTAVTRFGLGPKPGETDVAAADPRGWLTTQLTVRDPLVGPIPGLASTEDVVARVRAYFAKPRTDAEKIEARRSAQADLEAETAARFHQMAATDAPFRERWVAFWSNHLAVSTTKRPVVALAGCYERDVIRPHCTGAFADLLLASARHPAMLAYLDQESSVGPDSPAGSAREKGLNENYARELLELHTLGVDGGYTQADVTALAGLLTGWTVSRDPDATGTFNYASRRHQPGAQQILGTSYGGGEYAGEVAIRMLATHPATARHLARKLATHFVADAPADGIIDELARVWLATGGNLFAVGAALVGCDAAWSDHTPKLRTPIDFVVAASRALERADGEKIAAAVEFLGQELWAPPSPQGWPDDTASWAGPEGLVRRVEWAETVADAVRLVDDRVPDLAHAVLGPRLSGGLLDALRAARDRIGLGLLLASPEFQWR